MRKITALILLLVLCLGTLVSAPSLERYINVQSGSNANQSTVQQTASLTEMLYALGNLYTYLDQNYLYEIDNQKMQDAVISAMIDSLGDKYSYYVAPDKAEEYAEDNKGKYIGIGTYLTKVNPKYIDWDDPETYMVQITSPFPGGPADRSGLRAGDMISHVNGEEIYELNATEASKLIRGKEGEPLVLTVHRGSSEFEITLIPEEVTSPSTSKTLLDGDIAYIAITDFSMTTYDSVKEDLEDLLAKGAKSLILDVRNNGGGIVDAALSIANLFVPEGKILLTTKFKETVNNKDSVFTSTSLLAVDEEFPIYILANGGTASSSEILTAALQQNGRAKIVGSKTYGKGIMQYMIPFMKGYINVTVANYYTPDGSNIHGLGIEPDYLMEEPEYTDEELDAYSDFLKESFLSDWQQEHPEYSKENILAFAEAHKDSGVPETLLCLLMRNEYIYALDFTERPVADPDFDNVLKMAMELIRESEAR